MSHDGSILQSTFGFMECFCNICNASQPHERLHILYIYVNKMHRKRFFYEITTHFHLKVYFYPNDNANYSLLFIRRVHINIFCLILYYVTEFIDLNNL